MEEERERGNKKNKSNNKSSLDIDLLLSELLENSPGISEFEIANILLSHTQMMPPSFKVDLICRLVESKIGIGKDIAILFLLHADSVTRHYALTGLVQAFQNKIVTPISMNRLLIIRDWLPKEERSALESFIAEQRKKGVMFEMPPENKIIKILVSEIDGSGVQGFFFEVRINASEYRLGGGLVKHNIGIRDVWCGPSMSKRDMDELIRERLMASGSQQTSFRKVNTTYVRKLISHYIVVGHQHGEVPEMGLLQLIEMANEKGWKAESLDINAEMETLKNAIGVENITQTFIKMSLRHSANWFSQQEFTDSWFEVNEKIDFLVNQHSKLLHGIKMSDFDAISDEIFEKVLEFEREKWVFRFVLMAMWAKCHAKKSECLWKDCYVLAKCLYEGMPLKDISFMRDLCRESIIASIETMQERGAHLVETEVV